MSQSIDPKTIATFRTHFSENPSYGALQRAVTNNGIYKSSENNFASATNTRIFSHELDSGKVTDQARSGRCWLFATLNVLRHQITKDYNLEDFELSESYSFFWDKFEKANLFYEQIIATADKSLDDREVDFFLREPQGDGGWWEMAVSVIQKYGVVPKYVMAEATATTDSRQLNTLLNRKLRKDALKLRELAGTKKLNELGAAKTHMLEDVFRFLAITLGTPPTEFDFAYKDKKEHYFSERHLTPQAFFEKYTRNNLQEYISIVNDPSTDKVYNQPYIIDGTNNVIEGKPVQFLNVEMPALKKLALEQLKAKEYVWFGCDVLIDANKKGFMATDIYDFEGTFGVDFTMSKAQRLMSRDSSINHAMVLTGVDLVDDMPRQWKVENSWGEDYGEKGYYTMSDAWMDKYTYMVVIHRDRLSNEQLEATKKQPIVLPPWDPVNTIAA